MSEANVQQRVERYRKEGYADVIVMRTSFQVASGMLVHPHMQHRYPEAISPIEYELNDNKSVTAYVAFKDTSEFSSRNLRSVFTDLQKAFCKIAVDEKAPENLGVRMPPQTRTKHFESL